jgi:hypothetical protein
VFGCLLVALVLILLAGNSLSWALLAAGGGGCWVAWLAAESVSLAPGADVDDYDGEGL